MAGNLKKIGFILASLLLATIGSSFLLGFLTVLGGNIQVIGLNQVLFDPLITIAYMMLYYFVTFFYQPGQRPQYILFLFTLFLSFTVPFIQGAMYVVILYFLLRKLKII